MKTLILVCFLGLTLPACGVVTDATWVGGDGNWSAAAKWSTGVVPNNNALTNYAVHIDGGNAVSSTVTQTTASITVTIDKLVVDADDRLRLNNGVNLIVTNGPGGGVVTNAGTITLNGTGSGTDLIVSGGAITLAGGGTVLLGNNVNSRISGATDTDVLINEDNTMAGGGQVGYDSMGFDNRGTITADQPTTLILDPSTTGFINSGILQSTNGALLRLYDGVFTNTLGTIRALNASTVEVSSATIVGGLLTTEGSGAIRGAIGNSTLTSVQNTGKLLLPNGANFVLLGTITNAGTFELNGGGSASDLIVSNTVKLIGGGTITFGNSVNNRIYGDLLINEDNTIQGTGQIGLNNMGFINRGTLQANAGSTLYVTGGFSNFVAATATLTGGTYRVAGALKFTDANIVNNAATIILDGAASIIIDQSGASALTHLGTNTGSLTIQSGRNLSLSNSFVNYGTVLVATADSSLSVGQHRYTQAAGSTAINSSLILGDFGCTVTGVVEVTGGNLFVTNAAGNALLEVRSGTLTLSAGALTVDKLVITNACARFVHTGGVLVTNAAPVIDPDMDADGDGLPNSFELSYGLDPFDPRDAVQDDDGDGQPNIKEVLAGTDPTNSASALRIMAIAREGNNIRITWSTVTNRSYHVWAVSPTGGSYTNVFDPFPLSPPIAGTPTNVFWLDIGGATNRPARYYRVRLLPP
jgi:hypothetical protein